MKLLVLIYCEILLKKLISVLFTKRRKYSPPKQRKTNEYLGVILDQRLKLEQPHKRSYEKKKSQLSGQSKDFFEGYFE